MEVIGTDIYTIAVKRAVGEYKGEWVYASPIPDGPMKFLPWNGWTPVAKFDSKEDAANWWEENKCRAMTDEFDEYFDRDTLCIKKRTVRESVCEKL